MKNIPSDVSTSGSCNAPDGLYHDTHDKDRHFGIIQTLAEEISMPVDDVSEVYEEVLENLKRQARIVDYLPVLVAKKVKEIYRRQ